jgi:hypothetical protein
MKAFVLAFMGTALAVDTALLTAFADGLWAFLAVPTLGVWIGAWRAIPKREIKEVAGLAIGPGQDLDNPDRPKRVPSVVLEDKALNLGFLAIGGPGSGKTVVGILLLQYFTQVREGGWCYWDGKGDKDIYQKCMACGAQPDYFFSSELPESDTVNVVAGPVENVIDRLTQVLIVSESDYYRNAQRAALRSVLPLLAALEEPFTLRDLYVAFNDPEAGIYVMNRAKEKGVAPDVIKVAQDFFNMDEEQRQKDINGLLTRMQLFVTGEATDRLNAYRPTLDLDKAAKENSRVYFHMPYTHMARDIAILLTEQIGVIAKNRQLFDNDRQPWPQIFDDWGAFFYPNIGPITARCRSAKMPVSYLFQSKGQTDRVEAGGNFTTEVTDNIGGMFVLRVNGQESAHWAAQQFGEYESTELNVSDSSMWDSQSFSARDKARVKGDTLKNLDAGEAYISCLISGEAGRSWNKRYRARFPLPDFSTADQFDWPQVDRGTPDDEAEGLHLWRDFMNPDRLKQLKQQIVEDANSEVSGTPDGKLDEVDFL